MICVMNRDTCRTGYINEDLITEMHEKTEEIEGRSYPYTRVYMVDARQGHDYFLDVVESKKKINQLIEEAKDKNKAKVKVKYEVTT